MSIKNKIFLVFALTFAVLGGAGVYFYNSFSGHSGDFYYYEVERERSGEIIPFVELKNIVGNRSVRNNPVTTNDLSDDISGNLSSELTRHKNPTANNFSESSRSRYTYSRFN
ncbi:MAG: hypothetical protein GX102_13325, partial [Porphyromonadaceae bacterium]|nr:hypothetical protein [Porphyromonadaceae bacterium]